MAHEVTEATEVIRPRSPSGPQVHPIKVLHGRHDGYVSFALKEDDDFRPTFAIKATALDSMFPGYVDMLTRDSYVSINAAYTLAYNNRTKLAGHPAHRLGTLRYLCACYCDIDIYKAGLSFNQAYARVMDMCEAGVLPWASMVVNSGQGMWLLWLLHDADRPEQAHCGAWNKDEFDPLMIYSKINKALIQKLAPLGADLQCSDGAKYIRVPGSFRTDQETQVWWSIQGNGSQGFSYTLWELADLVGVQCRRTVSAEVTIREAERKLPKRYSGWVAAKEAQLCVIETLISLRAGGFVKGYRRKGALVYAMALYHTGRTRQEAFAAVREYGQGCTPVFAAGDCDDQTKSGYKGFRWSYLKIASELGVTRGEAEIISQRIGHVFPCADGELIQVVRANGRLTQSQALTLRRSTILRIVSEEGVLPCRVMFQRLRAEGVEIGNYVSVSTDYQALGLVSPRAGRLRSNARHRAAQDTLPNFA